MQKSSLYILIKCSGIFLFFPAFFCLLVLSSCANEELEPTDVPNGAGTCEARLLLNVGAFGLDGLSSRTVSGNDDEDRINDLWVFQYDDSTGEIMKTPVYIDNTNSDFNTNDINVDLVPNEGGSKSVVCIVANTGDRTWALENGNIAEEFKTYQGLLRQQLPSEVSGHFLSSNMAEGSGKTIPMYGESKRMVIASKCYVSVPLVRMFAKIAFNVDVSYLEQNNMGIESLTFRNIPFYCRVGTLSSGVSDENAATYPTDISWNTFEAGGVSEAILYVPENLQGKVSGMTSKAEAEGSFPAQALKIELAISDSSNSDSDDSNSDSKNIYTYTIYPGLDMKNDFNVKRNNIYKVNVKITNPPVEP